MNANKSIPAMILLAGSIFLAACETVPAGGNRSRGGAGMDTGGMEGLTGAGTILGGSRVVMPQENDSSLDPNDPCVNNLENLTGALLAYAGAMRRLPASLSDLPGEFAGATLRLSCPVSGKPYVYYPKGLRAPPELAPRMVQKDGTPLEGDMLILVDASPDHSVTRRLTDGKKSWSEKQQVRYGIVMEPPQAGRAVKMYVIPVEQALLDLYLKQRSAGRGGEDDGGGVRVRQIAPGGAF